MGMYKGLRIHLFLFLLLLVTAPLHARPFVVGGIISDASPPYGWLNYCDPSQLEGSIYFLLEQFIRQRYPDLQIEYAEPRPERMINGAALVADLRSDKLDAIIAMPPAPVFPGLRYAGTPYFHYQLALVFRREGPGIPVRTEDWQQLDALVVSSTERAMESAAQALAGERGYRQIIKPNYQQSVADFLAGEGDFLILGDYRIKSMLLSAGRSIEDFQFDLYREPRGDYFFVVRENGPWETLLAEFSDYLADAHESGRIRRLEQALLRYWIRNKQECANKPAG